MFKSLAQCLPICAPNIRIAPLKCCEHIRCIQFIAKWVITHVSHDLRAYRCVSELLLWNVLHKTSAVSVFANCPLSSDRIVGHVAAWIWLKWKLFLMKVKANLKLHLKQCNRIMKSNNVSLIVRICQIHWHAENNQTICTMVSLEDLSIWPFRKNCYAVQMSETFGLIHGLRTLNNARKKNRLKHPEQKQHEPRER